MGKLRFEIVGLLAVTSCAQGVGGRDQGAGASVAVGDTDGAGVFDDGAISASWDDGGQDGDGGGDGERLDVPAADGADADADADGATEADGAGDGGATGSCAKLDLLWVIDGSISMDVAQDKLSASIDSFVAAIEGQLLDVADFHIGVVTTTEYAYNRAGGSAPGSLVSQTGGTGSSAAQCGPFAQGGAWLSTADADIAGAFRCMAGIGLGNGNVELTAQAIISAVSGDGPAPVAGGPGCNAGFVRDDALLVIVNITDTDDPSSYPPGQGSTGDPDGWFAAITAAKGGDESRVVMVSILPPTDPSCTVEGNWSPLTGGTLDAPRLDALTQKFTHHYVGDICAPDYGVLLADALAEVDAGCEGFDPQG